MRSRISVVRLGCMLAILSGAFATVSESKPKPKSLLLPAGKMNSGISPLAVAPPYAIKSRMVKMNFQLLRSLPRATGATFSLELFPNAEFVGRVEHFEKPYADSLAWSGTLAGRAGTFTLVDHKGVVNLNVRVQGGGNYQIRPIGSGLYAVRQIDETKLKPCGTGRNQDRGARITTPLNSQRAAERALTDNGSETTVLCVYTPAARDAEAIGAGQQAGATPPIETLIDTCMAETNQAYSLSGITPRIRLVYRGLENYTGDGQGGTSVYTALPLFRENGDQSMDDVHSIRDQKKADVCVLIMEASDAGGLARMMNSSTFSTAFASSAFAVVDRSSASGNYAFGHEIGHIQGNNHDRDNSGGDQGVYSYSYGYRYSVNGTKYHTIMAYRPGALTLHFSNPAINDGGVATGVPENQPNPCNEAKTINNTASVVANFR